MNIGTDALYEVLNNHQGISRRTDFNPLDLLRSNGYGPLPIRDSGIIQVMPRVGEGVVLSDNNGNITAIDNGLNGHVLTIPANAILTTRLK